MATARAAFFLLLLASIATARTTQPAVYSDLRSAVTHLASDELEGRGIGTAGLDRAADFIEHSFRQFGLKGVGAEARFAQQFEYRRSASIDPATAMRLNDKPLKMEEQFQPMSISAEGDFIAPLVFAGFGVARPASDYDDYAGLDVKGKAVLVMRFEPRDEKGKSLFTLAESWSDSATFVSKAKTAAQRGAAAVLVVDPAAKGTLPFRWGGGEVPIPVVSISPTLADELLKRGGAAGDLKTLEKQINESRKPASVSLADVRVSGSIKFEKKTASVSNVMAVLPGEKSDEFVVVGAHYDHLGFGRGKKGEVFNGADDNASGVGAMLELARRLSDGKPLKRSILFVAFTAEEEGLIGSANFIKNPPVPLEQIVAMVNLDMVGRVKGEVMYIGGGGTAEPFKDLLKAADEASPLQLKSMGDGGLGPSDHMSFALKKIPVLFFFSGLHADYHRPSDDTDKLNFTGIEQTVDLLQQLLPKLADLPKPTYVAKFDGQGAHGATSMPAGPGTGRRVTLGIIPDYVTPEGVTGVRISGTTPDSPAAKAGLKEGDVIVKLGPVDVESLEHLSSILANAEAGKPTTIVILRDGQKQELPVTLAERKSD